jgi:hypothetical protein
MQTRRSLAGSAGVDISKMTYLSRRELTMPVSRQVTGLQAAGRAGGPARNRARRPGRLPGKLPGKLRWMRSLGTAATARPAFPYQTWTGARKEPHKARSHRA